MCYLKAQIDNDYSSRFQEKPSLLIIYPFLSKE